MNVASRVLLRLQTDSKYVKHVAVAIAFALIAVEFAAALYSVTIYMY